MKRYEIAGILGMAGAILITSFCNAANRSENIQQSVLRLHIIPNSDSTSDQMLKYKIRDRILEECPQYFQNMSEENMEWTVKGSLQYIEETARETAAEEGYDYAITAQYVSMPFDERTYNYEDKSLTLPAGVYNAVRINIAEASGQNFWCFMYPPLCIPAVEDGKDLSEFTEEELELLEEPQKFRCKLKCTELIKKLIERFCE